EDIALASARPRAEPAADGGGAPTRTPPGFRSAAFSSLCGKEAEARPSQWADPHRSRAGGGAVRSAPRRGESRAGPAAPRDREVGADGQPWLKAPIQFCGQLHAEPIWWRKAQAAGAHGRLDVVDEVLHHLAGVALLEADGDGVLVALRSRPAEG